MCVYGTNNKSQSNVTNSSGNTLARNWLWQAYIATQDSFNTSKNKVIYKKCRAIFYTWFILVSLWLRARTIDCKHQTKGQEFIKFVLSWSIHSVDFK